MPKLTRAGAIKKCLRIWSLCVRERDGNKCLLCGRDHGKIDGHHGIAARGVGCGFHWFLLDNGFSLCFQCHNAVHSRSGDTSIIKRWLGIIDRMVSKERQEEIIRLRHTVAKFTMEDLEGIYENLAKQYDEIKGRL